MNSLNDIITKAFNLFDEPLSGKYDKDNRVLARWFGNLGYREICRETKCSRVIGSITTETNTREYSLPSDFVAIQLAEYLNNKLLPTSIQCVTTMSGTPKKYFIERKKIGIEPIPDGEYAIDFIYFNQPTSDITLESPPELIPYEWRHVMAFFICAKVAEIDKGAENPVAERHRALYNQELEVMRNYFMSGQHADQAMEVR